MRPFVFSRADNAPAGSEASPVAAQQGLTPGVHPGYRQR